MAQNKSITSETLSSSSENITVQTGRIVAKGSANANSKNYTSFVNYMATMVEKYGNDVLAETKN